MEIRCAFNANEMLESYGFYAIGNLNWIFFNEL